MWIKVLRTNRSAALRLAAAVALGLLTAALWQGIGFARLCARVRGDTLRLHVLAASDSAADQALKLQVRDAVLEAAAPLLADSADKQQALDAAAGALPALEQAAAETIRAAGQSYGGGKAGGLRRACPSERAKKATIFARGFSFARGCGIMAAKEKVP